MLLSFSKIHVIKDLHIKVDGFTESYNSQVCMDGKITHLNIDYHLDYKMPYSAPEVFDSKYKNFNHAQDMFSFGIIAFILIFDR